MSRHVSQLSLLLAAVLAAFGCHPQQPWLFLEDGDLSHYMNVATEIEYPDVDQHSLDEVTQTHEPITLENVESIQRWHLSLEEVMEHVLANSTVMRSSGGRIVTTRPNPLVDRASETFSQRLRPGVATVYDPAIVESGYGINVGSSLGGTLGGKGVEAALSEFDARLSGSMFWEKNDHPQNVKGNRVIGAFFVPTFKQDLGVFNAGISKTTATGGTFSFQNNTRYDLNNNPTRNLQSDWNTNFEAAFTHPLLQGAGTQYNRIAGPYSFDQYNAGVVNPIDGVVIARIRTDLTLADFEGQLIEVVQEAEAAYWDLYYSYRDLDARRAGRDSALETWRRVHALAVVGARGGEAEKEAQARAQYFLFRAEVEASLSNLLSAENRLRFLMGLAVADGRLITPCDDPTSARVSFDWQSASCEALARRVEIRKQKWEIKKRELELIAARNHLLPRLDAVARYRWMGLGDDLISTQGNGLRPTDVGSTAFETLMSGDYQEWQLGFEFSLPIGFRQALTGVRHHQLFLAREKALLDDVELEVSHQLGEAVRSLTTQYQLTRTNFNRRVAAQKEVEAVQAAYEANTVTLDLLLDAQRRRADAEVAYYRSLVDYNLAIMRMHYRKGSLLEYSNVLLAEGPWPKKAYFDALRQARTRDAGTYLDYGFTRPKVISRGPYTQHAGQPLDLHEMLQQGPAAEEVQAVPADQEPTPAEPLPSSGASSHAPGAAGPLLQSPQRAAYQVQRRPARSAVAQNSARRAAHRANDELRQPPSITGRQSSTLSAAIHRMSYTEDLDEPFQDRATAQPDAAATGWKRTQRASPGPGMPR